IDVANHWAEEYIKKAYQLDLVAGQGEGKFNPDANVTRAEFLKMAMDASGIVGHAYREGECLDAANSDWYCYYLQGALDKDLVPKEMIEGVKFEKVTKTLAEAKDDKEAVTADLTVYTGKFNGNAPITREEMAAVAFNCLSYAMSGFEQQTDKLKENLSADAFTDMEEINSDYRLRVDAMNVLGIINGMGDGTFAPKANLTRAQATVIITKLADMLETVR
ncbi:MAG: S-layer homology domain-containing protein, partial [Clostridia bacterium]|nr:S-layer homology domain-containing protein [Clostridia bacterium]